MSFPWWETTVPEDYRATFPAKLEAMLIADARRKAQILQSLGYDYDHALMRVRAYTAWDYEVNEAPKAASKLDGVVAEVYGRRGARASAAPTPPPAKAQRPAAPAKKKR